jgi:hypothetical protein
VGSTGCSIQRILDSMSATPAYVRNRRLDILAASQLGKALINPILTGPRRPPNVARFMFLDPAATGYYRDWERMAAGTVAILRAEPATPAHDALNLLASWAAIIDQNNISDSETHPTSTPWPGTPT